MEHSRTRIIIDGAIAGIIGAVVVAVWFLIFDLIRGHALETPALLAATILHGSHSHEVHHGLALLALEYSLIHFGAFITFGIAGGLLLEACETESSLLFSLVIFFVAFEVFFIAVVLFLGPNVMVELTWWGIIVGNLLATAAMLSYFFWRHPALAFNLLGGWITIAREGITAGLVGGIVVSLWFMAYDLASGNSFHTPAILGAMVFQNATVSDGIQATLPLVLGYSILHFFGIRGVRAGAGCFARGVGMGTVHGARRAVTTGSIRGFLCRIYFVDRSVSARSTGMVENRRRKYPRADRDGDLLHPRPSRPRRQTGRAMGNARSRGRRNGRPTASSAA